jgi:Helix-hairpin-helix domain
VSGIGPGLAVKILSGMAATDLLTAIRRNELDRLVRITGVGQKTAERMVLELRDKLPAPAAAEGVAPAPRMSPLDEDLQARASRNGPSGVELFRQLLDSYAIEQLPGESLAETVARAAGINRRASRRVGCFTVAERPVLLGDFDEIDEDVFRSHARLLLQQLRRPPVKSAFLVHRPPGVERDLNEYNIV